MLSIWQEITHMISALIMVSAIKIFSSCSAKLQRYGHAFSWQATTNTTHLMISCYSTNLSNFTIWLTKMLVLLILAHLLLSWLIPITFYSKMLPKLNYWPASTDTWMLLIKTSLLLSQRIIHWLAVEHLLIVKINDSFSNSFSNWW